jgi:hypothetical protein
VSELNSVANLEIFISGISSLLKGREREREEKNAFGTRDTKRRMRKIPTAR